MALRVWIRVARQVDFSFPKARQLIVFRRLGFALPVLFAVASSASAQNACGALSPIAGTLRGATAGLGVAFESFSFETPSASNGSAAGVYAQNGISVTPTNLYLGHTNTSPYVGFPFGTDALYNFNNFVSTNLLISLSFNTLMRGVAFNFALATGDATISVWKTGVINPIATLATSAAEVNPPSTSFGPSCWWGFQLTGGSFDRLTIAMSGVNTSMALDNLEVAKLPDTTTTPEPSTIVLTLIGVAALAVARKRTRR